MCALLSDSGRAGIEDAPAPVVQRLGSLMLAGRVQYGGVRARPAHTSQLRMTKEALRIPAAVWRVYQGTMGSLRVSASCRSCFGRHCRRRCHCSSNGAAHPLIAGADPRRQPHRRTIDGLQTPRKSILSYHAPLEKADVYCQ